MKRLSLRRWVAGALVAAGLLAFVSLPVVPRLLRLFPPYLLPPHPNPDWSPWVLLRSTPVVSLGVFSAWPVLLLASAGWLLGAWVITPLLGLRQAAQRLAREEWDLALPSSRIQEVQDLIDSFAAMTRDLREAGLRQAESEQERRFFITAISHDLRTPLFSLRMHLQGLQGGLADTPEKRGRYVSNALARVENLERLIDDLLAYARVEYRDQGVALERVELGTYVGGVVQGAAARAAAKQVDLLMDPLPGACCVEADPNVLWRVFDNVLDNAVRHTPPGGQIRVRWMVGSRRCW